MHWTVSAVRGAVLKVGVASHVLTAWGVVLRLLYSKYLCIHAFM